MLNALKTKILSSLDNCFLDEDITKKREIKAFTAIQVMTANIGRM